MTPASSAANTVSSLFCKRALPDAAPLKGRGDEHFFSLFCYRAPRNGDAFIECGAR
jgi:hypothetical protein